MKNLFDIGISCSNKQMETLIKQMINPQKTKVDDWSYGKRKLFRENIRRLINHYKTMREFGECVKG